MQHLNHTRSTQGREIPVVADVGARDGHIVGVALNEDFKVFVVAQDFGNLGESGFGAIVDFVRTGTVEHVVGQRNVDHSFEHLDVHLLEFVARERERQVVGKYEVEGVAFGLGFHQLLDVLVGSVDFVHEFGDVDAPLVVLQQTLVE